jgi:hypothetical protein
MFQINDRVHCSRLGSSGKVIVTDHKDPLYPLEVEFDDGDTEVYTIDGRIYDGEDICLSIITDEEVVS